MNATRPYGPTVLRFALGILFLVAGIFKLMDMGAGATGMLTSMGFPMAAVFAWILIISEVGGGLLLLLGYQTRYAVWPLVVVMLVASVLVAIPGAIANPMTTSNALFHVLAIAGLVSIFLTGPGALAIEKV